MPSRRISIPTLPTTIHPTSILTTPTHFAFACCTSHLLVALHEQFMGSLRRECPDHILILNEPHVQQVVIIKEYVAYHNRARPHQGIGQRIPEAKEAAPLSAHGLEQ